VRGWLREWPKRLSQQGLKQVGPHRLTALADGTIADAVAGQLAHVRGQKAAGQQGVENQAHDQAMVGQSGRYPGWGPAELSPQRVDRVLTENLLKDRLEIRLRNIA